MPTRLPATNVRRRRRFAAPPTRAHPLAASDYRIERRVVRPFATLRETRAADERTGRRRRMHKQRRRAHSFLCVLLERGRRNGAAINSLLALAASERASDAAELARKSNLILIRVRARARILMPARAANPFSSLEQPTGGPSEHAQDCAPKTTSIEQCERQGRHRQRLILISLEPFLLRFRSPVRSFFR